MSAKISQFKPLALPPTSPAPRLFFVENFNGQENEESRVAFRSLLHGLLQENGLPSPDSLLNINRLPEHPKLNISLSHGKTCGLIGWILQPFKVGVDIEQMDRLTDTLIARVSSPSERAAAPMPSLLWSAKEAAFKSRSETVKVISSVEVFDWTPLTSEAWNFKARLAEDKTAALGWGQIRLIQGHSAAFFLADH